jgi:hypothetical protein
MTIPGGCEDVPSEYICFLVGTGIAAPGPNNHLMRDAKGDGASIVINGKTNAFVFPSGPSGSALAKLSDRGRRGGITKLAKGEFQKAFDEAVRVGERRVSDANLETLGRELKMSIAKSKPRS